MIFPDGFGAFIVVALLGVAVLFVILLVAVVVLVRPDRPDPAGRRPYATYLFATMFVSLLIALGGLGGVATAIGRAAADTGGRGNQVCFEATAQADPPVPGAIPRGAPDVVPIEPPVDDGEPFHGFDEPSSESELREVPSPGRVDCYTDGSNEGTTAFGVGSGLVAAAAIGVLLFHADRARELLAKEASHA